MTLAASKGQIVKCEKVLFKISHYFKNLQSKVSLNFR